MIFDAHHHLWKVDRGDYHWMTPDLPCLARDYLVDDLKPHPRKAGVTRTILVQAAQTEAETDFLLPIAADTDFIAGATGWLDLSDVRFPDRLAHYRRNPKFLAVRPMLQDLADDAWIVQPPVLAGLRHLRTAEIPCSNGPEGNARPARRHRPSCQASDCFGSNGVLGVTDASGSEISQCVLQALGPGDRGGLRELDPSVSCTLCQSCGRRVRNRSSDVWQRLARMQACSRICRGDQRAADHPVLPAGRMGSGEGLLHECGPVLFPANMTGTIILLDRSLGLPLSQAIATGARGACSKLRQS